MPVWLGVPRHASRRAVRCAILQSTAAPTTYLLSPCHIVHSVLVPSAGWPVLVVMQSGPQLHAVLCYRSLA
ncbi:hypothetical protein LY78DRAFT_661023 [Colletotrichum sublineola]|nr:hypothetical protein LY78DRAFT_661023 [Colletotrichum sublineola]